MKLSPHQIRVVGVLMEKALANPSGYPMTLNAVTLGCNQKNNRDPLVNYDEGEVAKALHDLTLLDLVSQAPPAIGARVNRFQHEAERRTGWGRRRQAVMAELFIRGPQTVGELKGRITRMMVELDIPGVQHVLDELATPPNPWVTVLPRQPGQSTVRYSHTLLDEVYATQAPPPAALKSGVDPIGTEGGELADRLSALERRVNELTERTARLESRSAG